MLNNKARKIAPMNAVSAVFCFLLLAVYGFRGVSEGPTGHYLFPLTFCFATVLCTQFQKWSKSTLIVALWMALGHIPVLFLDYLKFDQISTAYCTFLYSFVTLQIAYLILTGRAAEAKSENSDQKQCE